MNDVRGRFTGSCRLPSVSTSPKEARRFTSSVLSSAGAPVQLAVDLTLVASELVNNFVQYGNGQDIDLIVSIGDPSWWTLTAIGGATRAGDRSTPDEWAVNPPDLSDRIVSELVDSIEIDAGEELVIVRCKKQRKP